MSHAIRGAVVGLYWPAAVTRGADENMYELCERMVVAIVLVMKHLETQVSFVVLMISYSHSCQLNYRAGHEHFPRKDKPGLQLKGAVRA